MARTRARTALQRSECKLTKIGAGVDGRDGTDGRRESDLKVAAAAAPLIYFSKGDIVLRQSLF